LTALIRTVKSLSTTQQQHAQLGTGQKLICWKAGELHSRYCTSVYIETRTQ